MTKLKMLRMQKNLTQAQLAKQTDLNIRTLQYYEQGINKIDQARLATLLKLSIALNCEVKDLLEDPELIQLCENYNNV